MKKHILSKILGWIEFLLGLSICALGIYLIWADIFSMLRGSVGCPGFGILFGIFLIPVGAFLLISGWLTLKQRPAAMFMNLIVLGLIVFIGVSSYDSAKMWGQYESEHFINDISRLNKNYVRRIIKIDNTKQLQEAIGEANHKQYKVSIAAKKHSQGGHQFCHDCVVLDMTAFNKIISLDQKNKIIRVQSGATWEQIQNYINPYHLAIKVMQASNIFTVGGSMSANIHGNDPNFGTIIHTIRSFRLLLDDGSIVNVSRVENPELFSLVLGGYGLFGVILDVDLELTDDTVYERDSVVMNYRDYPKFFKRNILNNPKVGLHSAKLSHAPSSFLNEVVATTYNKTDKELNDEIFVLQQEKNILRNKFFFGLSRKFFWGKDLRWYLEKKLDAKIGKKEIVSRNNAMRSIVKFLEYNSGKDTDILQDYFIPVENFTSFVDGLREILRSEEINLLSTTIRYTPKDEMSFLSYTKKDSFTFVLYINQRLSQEGIKRAETWTQKMVDLALRLGGSYYLAYQLYPSKEQMRSVYPNADLFFEKKRFYDKNELFVNNFYNKYGKL